MYSCNMTPRWWWKLDLIIMATEKKKSPRKPKTNSLAKGKSLFDHIKQIREVQDPKYFDTLTDVDIKSWSNYMICRFLSMQPELIPTIAEIQAYSSLDPEDFYRLCIEVIPLNDRFYPYVKSQRDKWNKELVDLLVNHYQESDVNVMEYLEILSEDEIRSIVAKYGKSEKEIDKLLK